MEGQSSLGQSFMTRTMLFPCAAGVQIPQIGVKNSNVKIPANKGKGFLDSDLLNMEIVPHDMNPAHHRYIKMASSGLSFNEEVVVDRCMESVPYNLKYFKDVFSSESILKTIPKSHTSSKFKRKLSTQSQNILDKSKALQPLTPIKSDEINFEHSTQLSMKVARENEMDNSFFLTEISSNRERIPRRLKPIGLEKENEGKKCKESVDFTDPKSKRLSQGKEEEDSFTGKRDWDDYLVSRLSKLTANWVVHERMPDGSQKVKLSNALKEWYGPPAHTDLVREQISDGEETSTNKETKIKKKWKKKEASLLERVYQKTPPPSEALDPYSDDNKAPFYRQPIGIRKKLKLKPKEEDEVNSTAQNIQLKAFLEPPPVTLRNVLSPGVGSKIYETDNKFQQERLIGHNQIYVAKSSDAEIKMDSENKYTKLLEKELPENPSMWTSADCDKHPEESVVSQPYRGHKRWTGLPEETIESERQMQTVDVEADPAFMKQIDPKQRRKVTQNTALVSIVTDWRSKWFLNGQFADSTVGDLIRDMADIQPHVRLKAISTVSQALEYSPPPESDLFPSESKPASAHDLPEELFVALECLLDDSHAQVKKAAAITLYAFERPNQRASKELRDMLYSDSEVDRWASAQCLAHFGESDSDVVSEILNQILTTEAAIKFEQGIHLLSIISNSSPLVPCMVAEQLNSSSWRHRVIACKILPALSGSINKDITQKLSQLMWYDWHEEVRKAAAQCLGKASHGRDVHDKIRDNILSSDKRIRMQAINKLGQLGIMTAKLLPAFLECFSDPYVSIRCEVCITCGNLVIREEQVLKCLVHLAKFDPIWKVKALAIQAFGKIGVVSSDIKECLILAMRYEEKAGVRAEACQSIIILNLVDDDVIDALKERLLVESSLLVRNKMLEALSKFGYSSSKDLSMLSMIKSEVQKLCTKATISSHIILNEQDESQQEQLGRMVVQTKEDKQVIKDRKSTALQRIRSQSRSQESLGSNSDLRTLTPFYKSKLGSASTTPELLGREGALYTPSVDKEIQDILLRGEQDSVSGSASAKSRPLTDQSEAHHSSGKSRESINDIGEKNIIEGIDAGDNENVVEENDTDVKESVIEETATVGTADKEDQTKENINASTENLTNENVITDKEILIEDKATDDIENLTKEKMCADNNLYDENVSSSVNETSNNGPDTSKLASDVTVNVVTEDADYKTTEKTDLIDGAAGGKESVVKQQLKIPRTNKSASTNRASRASKISQMTASGKRSFLSRESDKERANLNVEVGLVYKGLTSRYKDMEDDLIEIDKGLSLIDENKQLEIMNVESKTSSQDSNSKLKPQISEITENENINTNIEDWTHLLETSLELIPKYYENTNMVPEKSESIDLVTEKTENNDLVLEKHENIDIVPERYENTDMVPQKSENTEIVPERSENTDIVPEKYEN